MDDKKFIDNYFAITENFQEFLKAIKKNYQSIEHLIVVLSVINHTKKTILQTIQNSSNQPNSEAMSKEINQALADHPDYGGENARTKSRNERRNKKVFIEVAKNFRE